MPEPGLLQSLSWAQPNVLRRCFGHVAGVYLVCGQRNVLLNLTISLVPHSVQKGPVGHPIIGVGAIRAFRTTLPFDLLAQLIDALSQGWVPSGLLPFPDLPALEFLLREGDPLLAGRPHFIEGSGRGGTAVQSVYRHCTGGETLQSVVGTLGYGEWRELEDRLPGGAVPFSDFKMLGRQLELDGAIDHATNGGITLLSPFWVWIEGVERLGVGGTTRVTVNSSWSDLSDLVSLAVVPVSDSMQGGKQVIPLPDATWSPVPNAPLRQCTRSIELPPELGPCVLHLNYDGRRIESRATGVGLSRQIAHSAIDWNLRGIRKRLFPGAQKSNGFEEGVAWLLHLCGFSAVQYGFKDLQGSPDILAFIESRCVILGECSTASPGPQEIAGLSRRAASLESAIRDQTYTQCKLLRVFFCSEPDPRPKDQRPLWQAPRPEDSVVLLYAEQLEALLERGTHGESPESCLVFLRSLAA